MDVGQLLALAGIAAPELQLQRERRLRVSWIRRYAVAMRRDRRRCLRQRRNSVHEMCTATQIEFVNRTRATRQDDRIDINRRPGKVSGQGKWKQFTPQEALRSAFASPATTMSSIAANLKSSARYVIDLLFVVARVLCTKQRLAIIH